LEGEYEGVISSVKVSSPQLGYTACLSWVNAWTWSRGENQCPIQP